MQDIDKIALEARKAYRFLFQYQRRVLDLMSFIGGSFNLKYSGGYPKFSDAAPRNGKGSLSNWAWDWLNMYFYEFHFHSDDEKVKFSAFIINDTGYYESECATEPRRRLDVEKFNDVNKSQTKLIFVAAQSSMWDSFEWEAWQSQKFLTEDFINQQQDNGIMMKIYSLNEFATENEAIESLRGFAEYCKQHDIKLQYQEKEL